MKKREPEVKVRIQDLLKDPQYKGKHVIIVGDEVRTAKSGRKAARILEEAHEEFPQDTPEIIFIPDEDTVV